jgi:hypothetical protein
LYCKHLGDAQEAKNANEYADRNDIKIEDLRKVLKNPPDLKILQEASNQGIISVFSLPGDNMVVPTCTLPTHEAPLNYIHIRNDKCPLGSCKEKKSKLHTLASKSQPLCLHTLLTHAVEKSDKPKPMKPHVPKINREISVDEVVKEISEKFPNMSAIRKDEFLVKSRKYIEELFNKPNKNKVINDHVPKLCKYCPSTSLVDWPYKPKKAFLVSMGHIARVEILLKVCRKCKRVFYPGTY